MAFGAPPGANGLAAVALSGVTPATIPADVWGAAAGPGTVPGGQVHAGFTTVTAPVALPVDVALPAGVAAFPPAAAVALPPAVVLPADVALAAAATGSITLTAAAAGAPGAGGAAGAAPGTAGAGGAGGACRFRLTAGKTPPAELERAGIAGIMTGAAWTASEGRNADTAAPTLGAAAAAGGTAAAAVALAPAETAGAPGAAAAAVPFAAVALAPPGAGLQTQWD